jgi:hypothetical protein
MRLTFLVPVALGAVLAAPGEPPPPSTPLESDLVERASARLIQIEVSVTGPPDVIPHLTSADFRVKLKRPLIGPISITTSDEAIEEFEVDAICGPPGSAEPVEHGSLPAAELAGVPTPRRVSYLFYFDQTHLTLTGRQRALDVSRELIERLVTDGDHLQCTAARGGGGADR